MRISRGKPKTQASLSWAVNKSLILTVKDVNTTMNTTAVLKYYAL